MSQKEVGEEEFARLRHRMVDEQLRARGIVTENVLSAMDRVPRHLFVSEHERWDAYADRPLPLEFGQSISQPYIVARMTGLLDLEPGARVLEIGTGSGYQAAILGEIVGEVWSVERYPALARAAVRILAELGYESVHVVEGDGTLGLSDHAPYDGILVTAAAPRVPEALLEQLGAGGRLVIPVGNRFEQRLLLVRRSHRGFRERAILGCRFVPLVGEEGYPW